MMAVERKKTRKQKIKQRERAIRRQSHLDPIATNEPAMDLPTNAQVAGLPKDIVQTQAYVIPELKKIGWITLLCVGLLVVATLLLADFSWSSSIRQLIGLPASFF